MMKFQERKRKDYKTEQICQSNHVFVTLLLSFFWHRADRFGSALAGAPSLSLTKLDSSIYLKLDAVNI